ncbi:hypothetical protein [Laceyella putida]|uniref:Uncharacterized protein n=1 Tax=Laceyella putida TaxID=110101 RepID=A0ABW2RR57_9BACL
MNEKQLESLIHHVLLEEAEELHIQSFEDAGVFTSDKGLVINTKDELEFQITIVKTT